MTAQFDTFIGGGTQFCPLINRSYVCLRLDIREFELPSSSVTRSVSVPWGTYTFKDLHAQNNFEKVKTLCWWLLVLPENPSKKPNLHRDEHQEIMIYEKLNLKNNKQLIYLFQTVEFSHGFTVYRQNGKSPKQFDSRTIFTGL